MHKIDGPGATPDNRFTEGDPAIALPATEVTADWLNAVQDEIVNVIESTGIVLDKEDNGQLLDALERVVGDVSARRVQNIAALRALGVTADDGVVYVEGYTSPGDLGGGIFRWDGASTDADDGGLVIKPTAVSGAGRWIRVIADYVTPQMFGAKGDGVADDTNALRAAIAAKPGGIIYAPAGSYRITDTVHISANNTCLVGPKKQRSIIINDSTDKDALLIAPPDPDNSLGVTVTGVLLAHITVRRTSDCTAGAGVHLQQAVSCTLDRVYAWGHFNNILAEGCRNIDYIYCSVSTLSSFTPKAGAASIRIDGLLLDNASWLRGFTHRFLNPIFSDGEFAHDAILAIGNVDFLTFEGGYFGRANAHVLIAPSVSGSDIPNVEFNGTYFDGVTVPSNTICVKVDGNGTSGSRVHLLRFKGAIFAQCAKALQVSNIANDDVGLIEFDGCDFHNAVETFIDVNLSTSGAGPTIKVTGGHMRDWNLGNGGDPAIKVVGCLETSVVGVSFQGSDSYPSTALDVNYAGLLVSVGNSFKGVLQEIAYDNVSRRTIRANASRVLSTTLREIDDLNEGTFTPLLKFGGSDTGITYGSRVGTWTRHLNRVFFSMSIILTSKGSASGNASIGGLPFPSGASDISVCAMYADGLDALPSITSLAGYLPGNSSEVGLRYVGDDGNRGFLTDANFKNNTFIVITGSYRIA